jgi:predicted nucleic acid-binding protein
VASEVWEKAIELYVHQRNNGRSVDDIDLLIAAFCIINGCTLVTNNIKHFTDFDTLETENWVGE